MALVSDAITDALTRLGVIAGGETPATEDMALGFSTLNILVDAWGTRRLTIPFIQRTTATLTANQASFTVGTGGNINIVRPVFFTAINFIDTSQDPDLEMPLIPYTDDQFAAIPLKALTADYPVGAYYNPTYASMQGTLTPWPVPTSATLLWAVYHPVAVPQFSASTNSISVPPGYHRFLVTQLAREMIPMFPMVPEPVAARVEQQAVEAEMDVKIANYRMSVLGFDPASLGGNSRVVSVADFLAGTF